MRKWLSIVLVVLFVASVGIAFAGAKFRVGLVFDVGGRGDKSFNDSAYNGLVMAAKELKGYIKDDPDKVDYGKNVEFKYLEPKEGGQDREQLLRALSEMGYNLVFGIGFMFTDSMKNVAKDFPNVKYALVDGYIPNLTEKSNITCLLFKEEEGSFLVGALAAMVTKSKIVGFVGGMDIPIIHKFEAGYKAGVYYVDPSVKVLSMYAGNTPEAFKDPAKGRQITSTFIEQGADVVYHAAGGTGIGVIQACAAAKKWAIGVDSDQGYIFATSSDPKQREMAKYILTSMLKRVDQAVYQTIEAAYKGQLKGGYKVFGVAENGVGYAVNKYNKDVLKPYIKKLEEIKAKIIKGEIKVPSDEESLKKFIKSLKK